ncbi:hypothetical protein N7499_012849 [Penicillium canescens]|nr:hypothetical protein N7499_012849 [Penicillium canescens]KAJ6154336.1 hypothetical protein N7485_012705 [Penicillium canescens]
MLPLELVFENPTAPCATLLSTARPISQSAGRGAMGEGKLTIDPDTNVDTSYRSMPSRNLAVIIINASKPWLKATEPSIIQIMRIMRHFFDSSLMLDAIQNHSTTRHGFPDGHEIFVNIQMSNVASYVFVLFFEEFFKLQNETLSQHHNIYWFILGVPVSSLSKSTRSSAINRDKLIEMVILTAQYMQIQDDYVDTATSTAMIYEKAVYGQDLDEGKFSFPVIHMFSQSSKRQLLEAIFTERLRQGTMPMAHKRLLWDEMASVGSASIIEKQLGEKKYNFRLILEFLSVEN